MRRWLLIVVMVVAAACGGGGGLTTTPISGPTTDPPAPATTDVDGPQAGLYGADHSGGLASSAYLELEADGSGSFRTVAPYSGLGEVPLEYSADGEVLALTGGSEQCDRQATGTYRWSFEDGTLGFAVVDDPCDVRARAMSGPDWLPLAAGSLVEARSGAGPVTVTSDVGDVTWQVVEDPRYAERPIAFGQGFAAIRRDGSDVYIATSTDGLRWESIPSPPTTPELLAAHGDDLYVVAGRAPTDVYATSDLGATWTRLPIEDPLVGDVRALAAGSAGVVLIEGWTGPARAPTMPAVPSATDGQTIRITVAEVAEYAGHDLAAVLYEGDGVDDLERGALGGFWSVVMGADSSTTETVRRPGDVGEGPFPYLVDDALVADPGTYTLVVWIDTELGPASRWVPVNTDGEGLVACQTVFEVGDDLVTDVVVSPELHLNGWNTDCVTGEMIPDTDREPPVQAALSMPGMASSTEPESSLWVLGDESFEAVAGTPSTIHGALAVDSGFVATSRFWVVESAGDYWTSADGWVWDEVAEPPRPHGLPSSYGDTVYSPTAVDAGVTSTDGGRTWSEPTARPAGTEVAVGSFGLVATDAWQGLVWLSPDGESWRRVLNTWPPNTLHPPTVSGDTILVHAEICGPYVPGECEELAWIGAIG